MHGLSASSETIADVLELVQRRAGAIDAADAARLVATIMGDRIKVGDASRYLVEYARAQGYDIPSYAFAGCGEIKQFFHDQGVADVPSWYEKLGVPADDARRLYGHTLIEVRDFEFRRMAILLHGGYHGTAPDFAPLAESGLIERLGGEPRIGAQRMETAPGESLDDILRQILDFILRGDTHGRPTF